MTDIKNWNYYYKFDPTVNRLTRSNMLYTPLINQENNIFCMNWDSKNEYQLKHGPRDDFDNLIDFFFQKEVSNLESLKDCQGIPELLEIDLKNKRVFFKWYGESLNSVIYNSRSLDQECPNWEEQLFLIISDIYKRGFYKPSLYPHCFYIDNYGTIRTFDFYACIDIREPFVDFNLIKGMVGPNSMERFDEAMTDNIVDVEILFKRALEHYIKWPNNALFKIYNKLFS
jgi:hypothetical protein